MCLINLPASTASSRLGPALALGRRVAELRSYLAGTGPATNPSCRRLVELGVLPGGASSMWRALAIYRLACLHPELCRYEHLGVAHVALLLKVPAPLQLALLRRAERKRWSRSQLQHRLHAIASQCARGEDPLAQFAEELAESGASPSLPGAGEVRHEP